MVQLEIDRITESESKTEEVALHDLSSSHVSAPKETTQRTGKSSDRMEEGDEYSLSFGETDELNDLME